MLSPGPALHSQIHTNLYETSLAREESRWILQTTARAAFDFGNIPAPGFCWPAENHEHWCDPRVGTPSEKIDNFEECSKPEYPGIYDS
ncbi:MAG TPA: hypothetical protein DCR87_08145 [Acidobacteria bacterium]|nr:hypothetical protein [Acidobacteriota bacterium]